MEINKEMLKGYLESIILSLLTEEDLYGYDIAKKIRSLSQETFEIKEGTMYVILKRLENNGLVESYWDDSLSGGGRRRYHHITEEGTKYLENSRKEWQFFKRIVDSFLEGSKDDKN
ncbi:PadR family transcriptional regulator [Desulfitobacterium sp. AusDCA]|uniref:PadR family transcriptional regulator n=1 Tax=Desulfitobacterium sp. AusDCA TaxID=3240383 RepID=UPI003DA75715